MSGTAWMCRVWNKTSEELCQEHCLSVLRDIVERAQELNLHNIAHETQIIIDRLIDLNAHIDKIDAAIGCCYSSDNSLAYAWKMLDYALANDVSINDATKANDALKNRFPFCLNWTKDESNILHPQFAEIPSLEARAFMRELPKEIAVDDLDHDSALYRAITENAPITLPLEVAIPVNEYTIKVFYYQCA